MRAVFIDDCTNDVIIVQDESYDSLKFMQLLVDGLIEFTPLFFKSFSGVAEVHQERLRSNNHLVVNEEGLFREDFAYNRKGSLLAGCDIVGPVVIVGDDGADVGSVHLHDLATLVQIFPTMRAETLTVQQVCERYIVPRGAWDVSEAWS